MVWNTIKRFVTSVVETLSGGDNFPLPASAYGSPTPNYTPISRTSWSRENSQRKNSFDRRITLNNYVVSRDSEVMKDVKMFVLERFRERYGSLTKVERRVKGNAGQNELINRLIDDMDKHQGLEISSYTGDYHRIDKRVIKNIIYEETGYGL